MACWLADLERRGLLDDTLVLFGSEFGRMPTAQGVDGRNHNITGFPMWLAGAGVKAGFSYGTWATSPLPRVTRAMKVTKSMFSLMNVTLPSPIAN